MLPGSSSSLEPPTQELSVQRDRAFEAEEDGRKRSLESPEVDRNGRKRSVDLWTAVEEGEEETVRASHHAKLAGESRVVQSFKQMESNSKVLGILFKITGVLPNTPWWYLALLILVASTPLIATPAFYFIGSRVVYTPIYSATFGTVAVSLLTDIRGFRKLLRTEVWKHLIVNLIKHKSDSLIRTTFVRLRQFALAMIFISVIMYLSAISLGLGINTGVTLPLLVFASLLVFPLWLLIALIVVFIMIGLMVAADIEHMTVVAYETFTEKRAPLSNRSLCKLLNQLRDLQCRIRVCTL
jgi:hypothetical protein